MLFVLKVSKCITRGHIFWGIKFYFILWDRCFYINIVTCRTQDFQVKKITKLQKWLILNLCRFLTSVMVTWIHQRLVLNLLAANKTLNYFICKVDILWKTGLWLFLVEKNKCNVCVVVGWSWGCWPVICGGGSALLQQRQREERSHGGSQTCRPRRKGRDAGGSETLGNLIANMTQNATPA